MFVVVNQHNDALVVHVRGDLLAMVLLDDDDDNNHREHTDRHAYCTDLDSRWAVEAYDDDHNANRMDEIANPSNRFVHWDTIDQDRHHFD